MRQLKTLAVVALTIAGLPALLTGVVLAQPPARAGGLPESVFKPVALTSVVATAPATVAPVHVVDVIVDSPFGPPKPTSRPTVEQPEQLVIVVQPTPEPASQTPKPVTKPVPKPVTLPATTHSVRGTATWYCRAGRSVCHYQYPDRPGILDLYAAAGPALRVGNWRGRVVRVCDSNSCIRITLIDWCQCLNGTTGRVIDLYWDAFHALDPNATGGIKVKVSW